MRLLNAIVLAVITLVVLIGSAALGGYGIQIKTEAANSPSVNGTVKSFSYEEHDNYYKIYPRVEYVVGENIYTGDAPYFESDKIPYEEGKDYDLKVHYMEGAPNILIDSTGQKANFWFYLSSGAAGIAAILAVVGIGKSLRKRRYLK